MTDFEMTDFETYLLDALVKTWRLFHSCRLSLMLADTELEAHKFAITALLTASPELKEFLDAYLTAARQSPALREKMNQKYASILGTSLQKFPGELPEEVRVRLDSLEKVNLDSLEKF